MQYPDVAAPTYDLSSLDAERFSERLRNFGNLISEIPVDLTWALRETLPIPLALRNETVSLLQSVSAVLAKGMRIVIENYHRDPRISNIIRLPEKEQQLLEALGDIQPLRLGALRPDFIIDSSGSPRICEVNARFPVNGFFLSRYLDLIIEKMSKPEWQPSGIAHLIKEKIVPDTAALAIKGRERGWDVAFLAEEARAQGVPFRFTGPSDDVIQAVLAGAEISDQNIFIELHQEEIASLEGETVKIVNERDPLNDIRTILIGHDKRALQVMSDLSIMSDYLSADDVQMLTGRVIPTFAINVSPDIVKAALDSKNAWVLKANRAGKSQGIYFGDDVSQERWESMVTSEASSFYVLQPKITPFSLHLPEFREIGSGDRELAMVGTILQLNGEFLGAGMFRASAGKKLNGMNRVFTIPSALATPQSEEFVW